MKHEENRRIEFGSTVVVLTDQVKSEIYDENLRLQEER